MRTVEADRRTLSTFHQYVQHEQAKIGVEPYTLDGPYGSIFDASSSSLVDDFWIMIEMGPLMQLGDKAVMPALMYLFHEIEELFDGRPTQLVLDEAWLFLKHELFKKQQQNWLKTTRKKNVACIYATQEIADAAKSDIASTILQQCHTKIYLPDEEATAPGPGKCTGRLASRIPKSSLWRAARRNATTSTSPRWERGFSDSIWARFSWG